MIRRVPQSLNVIEKQGSESGDRDMLSVSSDLEHLMDFGFNMLLYVTPHKD